MAERPAPPRRRLRLLLDLGADDLHALCAALNVIANDLDHEGRTERETTSGGYSDGWHLVLTDAGEHVTHDSFVAALNEWREARR